MRSTIIFGAIFFVTSLALTTLANRTRDTRSDVERVLSPDDAGAAPASPTDLFDPTAPLLSGQAGLTDDAVVAPDSAPEATVEPEAGQPEPDAPAPESGNPQ